MPNSLGYRAYRRVSMRKLRNAKLRGNQPKVAYFLWGLSPIKEEAKEELILREMEVQLEKMVDDLLE